MDNQKYEEYAQKFQKALFAIRKLKKDLAAAKQSQNTINEPIAIISTACRYPQGIETPQDFWNLLADAKETITEIPSQRWNIEDWHSDEKQTGKITTKKGGFLENIDLFDNEFFGISPREALFIDPQHRILLELACEALERAGINLDSLNGSNTGVYIGIVSNNDYAQKHFKSTDPKRMDTYSATGTGNYSASGRISYFLGMHGANMSIDTACSSSLVAIHTACKALQNGEVDCAIVGGSHTHPTPEMFVALSQMGALAPDGRSKAFDAEANGFSRGEGGAVFVLKKLSEAEKNGDVILGTIAGSGVNHDGRSNGFTAPNSLAQEMLVRKVLKESGLEPEMIDFIETHGTGTKLGDPIEFSALKNIFAQNRKKPMLLGAVKTNLGHTEGAAGVTGVLKVLLSMQHKQIPQNLHFKKPNPYLDWDENTIDVPRKLTEWESEGKKRMAGVSSFGIAGTNAHLIVEEYLQNTDNEQVNNETDEELNTKHYLLPISAKSKESLLFYAQKYKTFLSSAEFSNTALETVCSFAAFYRTSYEHRLCLVAQNTEQMISELESVIKDELLSQKEFNLLDTEAQIVFVFAGQGGQWLGMGRELYVKEPVFKESIDKFDTACKEFVDFSIVEELHKEETENNFENIAIIQPVLLAVEIAFAELWKSFGVLPDAVLGHSMGEIAAAYLAGALNISEAANVICTRSRLMSSQSEKGGMLVIGLTVEECQELIKNTEGVSKKISIAVSNSQKSTVLSGNVDVLQSIHDEYVEKDVFCRMVNVGVASHSQQMEVLLPELSQKLASLNPQNTIIPIYSTVRASQIEGSELTANYWSDNLRKMVRFSETCELVLEDDFQIFIEMSPHAVLTTAIETAIGVKKSQAYTLTSTQKSVENPSQEHQDFYQNLGQIYRMSDRFDWTGFYKKHPFKTYFTNLNWHNFPTYAWSKQSFWLDTPTFSSIIVQNPTSSNVHPLLGSKLALAGEKNLHIWNTHLNTANTPYLAQHRITEEVVFPASAYVEMILAAIDEVFDTGNHVIKELKFHQKLIIPTDDTFSSIQLKIKSQSSNSQLMIGEELDTEKISQNLDFAFYVKNEYESWELFAEGKAQINAPSGNFRKFSKERFETEIETAELKISKQAHYQTTRELGIDYGEIFQGIDTIFYFENIAWVKIDIPKKAQNQTKYLLHPAVLDACLQGSIEVLPSDILEDLETSTFISASIGSLQLMQSLNPSCEELFVHIELTKVSENRQTFYFDMMISDGGKILMRLFDLCVMKLAKIALQDNTDSQNIKESDSNAKNSTLNQLQNCESEENQLAFLTTHLQTQIAKITYNPIAKINPKKPFKLLGLDSLMNVQLASQLSKSFATKIPISSFQAYPNVEEYVGFLLDKVDLNPSDFSENGIIEENTMYKDALLDKNIALNGLEYDAKSDWKNIFLTGVTGFSGAFMLRELIENTYATIYCLVRASNKDLALKRIEDNLKKQGLWKDDYRQRIVPLAGDLARPKLGLIKDRFDKLAEEIDVIFHIGFLVNWVYSYSDVRDANILGTKELFKLATQSKIKALHFSSSIATFSSINLENGMHIEEKDILEDGEKLKVGYTQAKWVVEKLIREAQKRGLPFSIYRFGDVRGYSQNGVSNTTDFMSQFIKGCIKMGCVPDKGLYINMLPVDYLIRATFRIAANPSITNDTFHFSNPQVISWTEFVIWMQDYGFALETIPFDEWTNKLLTLAKENLNDETYRTLAPIFVPLRIDEETENTSFWDLLTRLNYVSLDMKNTNNALLHTTLSCPNLVEDGLLKTYFDKYIESGFLTLEK